MADSLFMEALTQFSAGDQAAGDRVMELAYPELKRMARRALATERSGHTLQPTALVSEVWLKLNGERGMYESRARFFGLAARAMREILVDHARRRLTGKRNAGETPARFEEGQFLTGGLDLTEVVALDQSMDRLAELDPRKARVVELRFFAGLSDPEIAEILAVSERTVKRDWLFARAYLFGLVYGA